MSLLMSISKHVLSSTEKFVVYKLPTEVFQFVSTDLTESVYLALWIFDSRMAHIYAKHVTSIVHD